ncbi:acyl-CoA synthetase [Carbonactinospora thermoautotrophica]|uniref:acyl--CoA ligase family protein n=1 Tax=Carbonactinospora thermoautotrophica TaxID=1469144 RepID=UPI00226E6178|nr:acyl--CoA ligase family protein [Carbonactinospora thermoautotrophica]MCX9191048.1 acyl-CoA synthetase [Carbonactinospora thermoautotrophica]
MQNLSFEPLTPTNFLRRSALVFAERTAVVDGEVTFTYAALWERVRLLAGGLAQLGVRPGDRVAVLAPNSHMMLEATFGVPAAGALLVPLNIRLSPDELAYILDHAGVSVLLHDAELTASAEAAREASRSRPRLVCVGDSGSEYEALLSSAEPLLVEVADERSPLSINYTSGTTGRPKGVVYHHRGAYLQALAMALHTKLDVRSSYLWTLPMFHCHGWCFPWAVTAVGATHVCLRKVDPEQVWRLIRAHKVTHLCGAPTVLMSMLAHPHAPTSALEPRLLACVGGAPPSPALLERALQAGIDVIHLYGLTETYGPAVICQPQPEWSDLPVELLADLTARQGVGNVIAQPIRVLDENGNDVPADASTTGQIALRGNDVMVGYYRDPEATRAAAPDGWFRSGDLAVRHPDGYVQLVDRVKDVIISGGENIASVEVENALMTHPDVLEAAVVARPDPHWGEVPIAYVTRTPGATVTEAELIDYVRSRLARFKAPKAVVFTELPKTSTGKIRKNVLRQWAAGDVPHMTDSRG